MKIGAKILILAISAITFVIYGQGRGMINRMEREEVIAIISSLKPEMTESDTIKFLLDRGLDRDWGASGSYPTNHTEWWYRFGTTNIEELRVEFRPKQDKPGAFWQQPHGTNYWFFKAQIYRVQNGGLATLWSTNAPDRTIRTKRWLGDRELVFILGQILILVGLVINIVGHIMIWVAANRVSRGWFVACILVIGWPFFLLAHFSEARRPFAIWLLGLIIIGVGMMIRDY